MAIRKSMEEHLRVDGNRDIWIDKVQQALELGKFTDINCNKTLYQVNADYKKITVWGEINIALISVDNTIEQTDINIKATSNVDNIYALFKSPNKTIIETFKASLK